MQPSTIMTITPEVATRLLENNSGNRTISDQVVQQYAREMRAGRWKETGNPINISKDGTLLNGQHRLWAIVESGVTLRFHVIYEEDSEAFATFDTGRVRTADVLLGMVAPEHPDKACAAGAARLVYMARNTPDDKNWNKNTLPSRSGLVAYAETLLDEPAFWWATTAAKRIIALRAGRTWYATALYLLASAQDTERGKQEVTEFHIGVSTGAGLATTDPRLTLRNFMIKHGGPVGMTEQRQYVSAVIRCFNAWVGGKRMSQLQLGRYEVLGTPTVVKEEK